MPTIDVISHRRRCVAPLITPDAPLWQELVVICGEITCKNQALTKLGKLEINLAKESCVVGTVNAFLLENLL